MTQEAGTSEWSGTGNVLLVDDEKGVREVGTHMLKELGFTVLTAANGAEGVDLYRKQPDEISCVLLDLSMPVMGGGKALSELQKINREVEVIISSGYSEQDARNQLSGQRVAGFIHKPYTLAQLREILRGVLGTDA